MFIPKRGYRVQGTGYRIITVAIAILVLAAIFTLHPTPFTLHPVFADIADQEKQLQDIQSQIQQLQDQLAQAQGQEKTLKSQLQYIDTQAQITQLKIDQTNTQIAKLGLEIADLSGRIDRLSGTVDSLSQLLLDRIIQTYKYGNVSTVDLLFSSHGFSDLLERLKYIQVVQEHDKKVLYQLQATKATYKDQKSDRESRETQQKKLKQDLVTYQTQLDQDKEAKARLLRDTQNNEAVYQSKLQAAISEQQAILSLLTGGGNEVTVGPVHKGDIVGYVIQGRSACSSGTHLHFEVHVNNQIVDPSTKLAGHSVTWDNSPDGSFSFGGSWDWPVADPVYIEQGFGSTWWAQHGWYTNPPGHTGIDIYSPSSPAVKAVHDGTLSNGGISCGGGTLSYKRVDHGDGTSSYYLHVL